MSDQYTKKPVTINAMQYIGTSDSATEVLQWAAAFDSAAPITKGLGTLSITTLEGKMIVDPGDWVICGVKGEFYPCKPDIFDLTYNAAEQTK